MNPHITPNLSLFRHSTDMQIRFNDVDVLGHVNNTIYFTFFDTGKAQYMSQVRGMVIDWKSVDMVIANVDCAFLAPTYYGEQIEVLTRCTSIGSHSLKLLQVLVEKNTSQIKAMAESVMVCINLDTAQSKPVPDEWRKQIEDFEGQLFPAPDNNKNC